jgi:hypothetical protein
MFGHDREALIIGGPGQFRAVEPRTKNYTKDLKWQCYCKIIAKFSTICDTGLVPLTSNTGKLIVLHVEPISRI